jgi:rSAM/selenodomain-associated transferase 1
MAWSLPAACVFGILGKQPRPGHVKTRLAAELGDDHAAAIYDAMLFDILETWSSPAVLSPGGRRVLVFAPGDAGPWFDRRVPPCIALQPQAEGGLGERMAAFFAGEFDDGAERVVLIGADSPTLDPTIVISAFLCLESRDVVLGPATDGGYYLVGARGAVPPIFDGIDSARAPRWAKRSIASGTRASR